MRRRMRQKMEFLSTDLTEPEPPTETELQAYLDARMDRFHRDERLSFTHVYLKEDGQKRAPSLLQQLAGHSPSGQELEKLGDASLLPGAMQQVDQAEIGRVFGKGFVESLSAAPLGRWSGPYTSPYGQAPSLCGGSPTHAGTAAQRGASGGGTRMAGRTAA